MIVGDQSSPRVIFGARAPERSSKGVRSWYLPSPCPRRDGGQRWTEWTNHQESGRPSHLWRRYRTRAKWSICRQKHTADAANKKSIKATARAPIERIEDVGHAESALGLDEAQRQTRKSQQYQHVLSQRHPCER